MDNGGMDARITCPLCNAVTADTMQDDRCIFFWECPQCHTLLRPQPGDCCVFCSYGDAKCPPAHLGECGCQPVPSLPVSWLALSKDDSVARGRPTAQSH